jgi:hypothetical protein
MPGNLNLDKQLEGLSPEARLRVENALKQALAKERLMDPFDRSGYDRGPYDRGGVEEQLADVERFSEKEGGTNP